MINILLDISNHTHLADFGLSIKVQKGQLYLSNGGSFEYTAPEIFMKKPHNPLAGDAWALGVVFAMMATGSSPWKYQSLGDLKIKASHNQTQYKKPIPDVIDDLIHRLIVINPEERLTMKQVIDHPAFKYPAVVKNKIHSFRNSFGTNAIPIVKWSNIKRKCSTSNSSNSIGSDQESIVQENSTIHSVSSFAIDVINKSHVRQRLKKRERHSTESFLGNDVVEEIE